MTRSGIILCVAFALLFAAACITRRATETAAPEFTREKITDGFRRGLWVRAVSVAVPDSIPRIIQLADALDITDIFVQVVVGGYAYYNSELLPRSQYLSSVSDPGYDPLASIVKAFAATPTRVHAWINALLYWSLPGPPDSVTHVFYTRPEWFIRDVNRRSMIDYSYSMWKNCRLEGLYLDPENPEVVDFLQRICAEIVSRYPVDGIHLDFIRYPGILWGLPENDEAAVLAGIDGSEIQWCNPIRYGCWDYYMRWQAWHAWQMTRIRRHSIAHLVLQVRNTAKTYGLSRDLQLSAAVFADPGLCCYSYSQAWIEWPQDVFLPVVMAYTPSMAKFRDYLNYVALNRTAALMGIGFLWPGMVATARYQENATREAGVSGVCYFDFTALDTIQDLSMLGPDPVLDSKAESDHPAYEPVNDAFADRPPAQHVREGRVQTPQVAGLEFAAFLLSLSVDPGRDLARMGLTRDEFVDLVTQDVAAFAHLDQRVFPLGDELLEPPQRRIRFAFIDWNEGDSLGVLEKAGMTTDLNNDRLLYPAAGDPLIKAAFAAQPHSRHLLPTPAGVYVFVVDTIYERRRSVLRTDLPLTDLPVYLNWTMKVRAHEIIDVRD
ncbi:family 10 glycosylhydrolase [candidate division WOR-3 bacterium]|nr:family 10 glycosylhydrolase [candidate division WOR-3 bacterium]